MPRYTEIEEDYYRSRSRGRHDRSPSPRDRSADYHSVGPAGYDEPGALIPLPPIPMSLEVPSQRLRPRSVPPGGAVVYHDHSRGRSRGRSRSSSRSSSASRDRGGGANANALGRARQVVEDSFTRTPAGLGAGLLGAVVGGLAMRKVSDAARGRSGSHHHGGGSREDAQRDKTARMAATLVGAVVGGLGANAIERKFEVARERGKERQEEWERKWGKESDLPHYDTGDRRKQDHGRGRDRRRGDDDDYDYVYERDNRARRNRSEDGYRYHN